MWRRDRAPREAQYEQQQEAVGHGLGEAEQDERDPVEDEDDPPPEAIREIAEDRTADEDPRKRRGGHQTRLDADMPNADSIAGRTTLIVPRS